MTGTIFDLIDDRNARSDLVDLAQKMAASGQISQGMADYAKADPTGFREIAPNIIMQQQQMTALQQAYGQTPQNAPSISPSALSGLGASIGDQSPNAPIPQTLPPQQSALAQVAPQQSTVAPSYGPTPLQLAMQARVLGGGDIAKGYKALQDQRELAVPAGAAKAPEAEAYGPDGTLHLVPGAILKGANGEILTVGSDGQVTQGVPVNPKMKQKFEDNLSELNSKVEQLHQLGGTLEEGATPLANKINQYEASDESHLFGLIPSGQSVMQGTQKQSLRDDISSLVKQTMPLYMQAMGIPTSMERAQGAQEILLKALGSGTDKSRQHLLYNIANLSREAGTGDLTRQIQASNPKLFGGTSAPSPSGGSSALSQVSQPQGQDPRLLQALQKRGYAQ